jgi:glucokinase
VPVAEKLKALLGTKVAVGNDVRVATTAEVELGAGREFNSMLGVFWGTGVGGGVILNRTAWTGRGAGGEIGHMVVEIDGAKCPCGRRGCMEAYAGRAAMEAEARKRHEAGHHTRLFHIMKHKERDRLSSGVWAKALEDDDKMAHKLIDRAVWALGAGVASAVNLLDVEAVIIGGGMGVRLGEPYAQKILDSMMPHLFRDDRPPKVVVAALGDLGGAVGASLLVKSA